MVHNILVSTGEKEAIKKESIKRFWQFAACHNAATEVINGRLHLILNGGNLDAFCAAYKDGDIINLKLIDGKLCVEAKWLCEHASDDEILAKKPSDEK